MEEVHIRPAGDCAASIEFGTGISEEINDRVLAFSDWLEHRRIPGIIDTIPSYSTLLVMYDRAVIGYGKIRELLSEFLSCRTLPKQQDRYLYRIPCCYGRHFGKDMETVTGHTGLSPEEIVTLHSSAEYRIFMMGFLPGFVYLGGLPEPLTTPRLATPRLEIPAGAVGIGGNQTGVYPLKSPGGWQLIGSTPVNFYDPNREEPVLCSTGDHIRFVPVDLNDYYEIRSMVRKGTYVVPKEAM